MGLFRRKDERAIPEPGTPEFEQTVEGSALPDDQSVAMGEAGWAEPEGAETTDEPEKPRRREALIRAMGRRVPNSGGFGGGIPRKKKTSTDE
jgi:hypothetical protein